MRAALGVQSKDTNYIYSLENETFSWKRLMSISTGLVAKLGHIKVRKVPVIEAYESLLDKSIEKLSILQENIVKIENENRSLKKDRETALNKIMEIATAKEEWEKKLYGQFVAVLNAKKERILDLEESLDLKIGNPRELLNSNDGQPPSRAVKEEEKMERDEEDPYAGDTDVDSDVGEDGVAEANKGRAVSPPVPSSSSALMRRRDIFDSFDSSPGSPSPVPVLPKRARMQTKATALTSTSTSTSARNMFRDVFQDNDDDDDDPGPQQMATDENTQDLLDEI